MYSNRLQIRHTFLSCLGRIEFVSVLIRVADPHGFNADPDPAFFLIADPDPGSGSRVW
jgi:hypothetical protein